MTDKVSGVDETFDSSAGQYRGDPSSGKLLEIARYHLFIGIVGEESREWASQKIFMGWAYGGKLGAIVAGFFFTLPTFGSNRITSAREPGIT